MNIQPNRQPNIQRRKFLSQTTALALLAMVVPGSLLAKWPKLAFEKTKLDEALAAMSGGKPMTANDAISISAPKVAENGAQVRVTAKATAPNVQWISLFVEKNPVPMVAQFMMHKNSVPHIATNVKVRETSKIVALAKVGDNYYTSEATVKVTAGGCA